MCIVSTSPAPRLAHLAAHKCKAILDIFGNRAPVFIVSSELGSLCSPRTVPILSSGRSIQGVLQSKWTNKYIIYLYFYYL